jgi:hypothetical protein
MLLGFLMLITAPKPVEPQEEMKAEPGSQEVKEASDGTYREELPPLDEMYEESPHIWTLEFIHIRCAGVHLFIHRAASADSRITTRFIDKAQGHALVATRIRSDRGPMAIDQAYEEIVARTEDLSWRYAEHAEPEIQQGLDPRQAPIVARDLAYCNGLSATGSPGDEDDFRQPLNDGHWR